jgi:hypothetical protein
MITYSPELLATLDREFPGLITSVRHYEKQTHPPCPHPECASSDTALILTGPDLKTLSITGVTTKCHYSQEPISNKTHHCNSCGENF